MSGKLPAKSPTVLFREMDEGGVLFCTRAEGYFGLNPVSAHIWSLLPEPGDTERGDLEQLLDSLQRMYPDIHRDQLATDVGEFLDELEKSELVVDAQTEEA